METIDAEKLLKQLIEGNESAFRLLFDTYSRRLFHLAYAYLHSKELAEEAVLDVFTTIWNKRDSLSVVKDIERYLYISVKNQALHYIRRNYIKENDSLDLYEIELLPEDNTPEKTLIDHEYQSLIQDAINSLPPKCKEVFRLVLADKLKNREIADLLDISEKTVNQHIALAYKRISAYVNKQYSDKDERKTLTRMILFSMSF